LPFNNIKWLSDYSRRWQVKGLMTVKRHDNAIFNVITAVNMKIAVL